MMNRLDIPATLHLLAFPTGETDAEKLSRVKRALRDAAQSDALVISGSFEDGFPDEARSDLLATLLDAPLPVLAVAEGSISASGLSLLLTADRIVLSPDATVEEDWRSGPGTTTLLSHRLGPHLSRQLLFGGGMDPADLLIEPGLAVRSGNPSQTIIAMAAPLTGGLGRRIKRSLKASDELPFAEALKFELWFATSSQESTS